MELRQIAKTVIANESDVIVSFGPLLPGLEVITSLTLIVMAPNGQPPSGSRFTLSMAVGHMPLDSNGELAVAFAFQRALTPVAGIPFPSQETLSAVVPVGFVPNEVERFLNVRIIEGGDGALLISLFASVQSVKP